MNYSFADTLNCGNGYTSIGGDYIVPPVNITAPNDGETSKLLYSVNKAVVQSAYTDCRVGAINWVNTSHTLMDVPPGEIYTIDGYTVYPTNIKGLGVSINESATGTNQTVPVWPGYVDTVVKYNNLPTNIYINLKLWRTPGFIPPIGTTQINSMTVIALIRPTNTANTIAVCAPGSIRLPNNNDFCGVITRRITFSASFQLGTCELLNPNQTVEMGAYNYDSKINAAPPWVDAGFQLKCPQAWGYGGTTNNPTNFYDANNGSKVNNSGNQPIKIKVTPINPSVNPMEGIFQLNSGGAEGFDLQLAWGDPASQGNIPAKPVQLGSWVNANTANSNYSNTAYAIGASAVPTGADGKIKMSARYIRNSQDVKPGVANASVEVLATYN
ncbi:hypothetical protein LVQ77_15855 [Buttiauxella sp. S04-F03]|uniref:hypothetical protein n=1 Tax=Buttiauxella sp. W03-F01 TaxID=2904524 RepID=UPI001E317774|nr:hypothetical protein [Buttiauxella sp. W03-F01]MCE0801765.1 hypothetical protein [Buttiauxella sp. W03-F01]